MKIKVIVTLKNGVLDPQGKAIQQTLNGMNFGNVEDVRQGKYFEIEVKEKDEKKAIMDGKGILNNRISEHILTQLNNVGIKNHLVKRLNMREQLVQHVEIIPIEFIVRNIATGSLTKRLGIEDGTVLDNPLIEYCLKDDALGDPLVSTEHILAFKWMEKDELNLINK